jgi:integrating conjugative element protein (TIGR03761 family)
MSDVSTVPAPRRHVSAPGAGKKPIVLPPMGTAEAPDGWGQAEFLTEVGSPFGDGYSISKEEEALADMFAMDHPDKDPRWPRYVLLIHRKETLERSRLEYRLEQGSEKVVEYIDATKMTALGSLVNDGEDRMVLHTKESFRLFMGRRRDPDGKYQPIIGIKTCASAMRGFWAQSANDNPYADWALLRAVHGLRQFTRELKVLTDRTMGSLRELEAKGLSFSLLCSAEPQSVPLQFKSPYGYLVAEFVVDYDYFTRVAKTAVRKGRLTDAQERDLSRNLIRRIRGWMEELARFNRFLWRPELVRLSRADFLPGADPEALKRVEAVTAIFGPVPPDIFSGRIQPPYTKRRTHITDAERALLERVGQELATVDAQADASDDESSDRNLL